ncbi:MAG: SUMF1/EgtB/PvdO family nonheme iron enzyme [Planctomycetia bacterium]|nr:SUMF1/EgtB/PvdO family nonheme iron enzyme [Planctomycetia bacterium]
MKKTLLLLILATLPCLLFAEEAIRAWKSKTGKTIIEAKWDSENDAEEETVFLSKNGKRYRIPLKNLSEEDQKYVFDGRAKKAQRGSEEEDFGLEEVTEEKPSGGAFEMPKARKFAVLVGVTEYATMHDLRYTVRDVEAIREQLLKLGFEDENIYLLTTKNEDVAKVPTQRNVERTIASVLSQAGVGDLVFFAFAGHGAQLGDTAYFCTQDTIDEDISGTAVSITQAMDDLAKSEARFKWIVVDACRNNPFRQRVAGVRSIQKIDNPPEGIALFQSCAPDEFSYEDESVKHGLFTSNFVRGLSGEADLNNDGSLTFLEVCTYTTNQTVRDVQTKFQKHQRPYLTSSMSDFILTEDLDRPKAIAYFAAAQQLRREKKYDEAKREIDKALELYPEDQEYLDERGMLQTIVDAIAKQKELEEKAREEAAARKKAEEEAKRLANIPRPTLPDVPQILPASGGRTAGERMVKTVKGVEYAFRWCPAGEFMMGSPEGELGRYSEETQHRVRLTKGFWMLETEVTQAMWESVMGDNPSNFKGSNLPVEKVSWKDCQEFCQKLRSLGLNVQLPTEAQWEYACRAGTTTSLNNGKNITSEEGKGICYNLSEVGWYEKNLDLTTHIVGQKKPNAWGLYDMHGNVYEWCQDWYDSGYYAESPTSDPEGPSSGAFRVFRGGSWNSIARFCRSAFRFHNTPAHRVDALGFRLALVP